MLKSTKTKCFSSSIVILGHEIENKGLGPSADKVAKLRDHPTPEDEKELDHFLYMTLYLKSYIPGSVVHSRIMKEAILVQVGPKVAGKKSTREKVGWQWTDKQQRSFDDTKRCIVEKACIGEDPRFQYHLSCDASQTGLGAVLFQLPSGEAGTVLGKDNRQEMQIIMSIA